MSIFDFPIFFFLHNGQTGFIIVLPFSPVNKNEKINIQLLLSTINIKTVVEPYIFSLFAGKQFPQSSVNYYDVN